MHLIVRTIRFELLCQAEDCIVVLAFLPVAFTHLLCFGYLFTPILLLHRSSQSSQVSPSCISRHLNSPSSNSTPSRHSIQYGCF
eukprot:m.87583 g.87583  ORF g.87583 m.87583 type:complete len:84 (-) comp14784_c0_seq3:905-1156(-)